MTGNAHDLTGRVFGGLTAKSVIIGEGQRSWLCECICGNNRIVPTFQLNSGAVKTCGVTLNHLINKVGDRFGKLVIARIYRTTANHKRWAADCICDCGNTHTTSIRNLQRGASKHCLACVNHKKPHQPAKMTLRNIHFGSYKRNAKKRGLVFSLTKEQFIDITSGNCYFCSTPPSPMTRNHIKGIYLCNGIDRIDSFLGYTMENCKPCCSECNYLKGNRSNEEFISRVRKINENYIPPKFKP